MNPVSTCPHASPSCVLKTYHICSQAMVRARAPSEDSEQERKEYSPILEPISRQPGELLKQVTIFVSRFLFLKPKGKKNKNKKIEKRDLLSLAQGEHICLSNPSYHQGHRSEHRKEEGNINERRKSYEDSRLYFTSIFSVPVFQKQSLALLPLTVEHNTR